MSTGVAPNLCQTKELMKNDSDAQDYEDQDAELRATDDSVAEVAPTLRGDTLGIEPALAWKMLDFEKRWMKTARRNARTAGAREEAVRKFFTEEFGKSPMRYHQVLNRLIDSPAAEAAEPILVHQLRRIRDGE